MVEESVIRKMTRLALEYKAINLSQGFPNEPPPLSIRLALARAVLEGSNCNNNSSCGDDDRKAIMHFLTNCQDQTDTNHHHVDEWNQYSPPMGRMDLRSAIADHYRHVYDFDVNSHGMDVTVTLGATEALATALRSVCDSSIAADGNKVIIIEPFHELYPSQCQIFSMEPIFLTLHQLDDGQWKLNETELQNILIKEENNVKAFILNSPHNPTGKVFTREELLKIVQLCVQYNVAIITDDIYEHMIYQDAKHCLLPKEFPKYAHQMLVCNSIGKSASATGWRVGWCLHPKAYTSSYRGIHDQLVVMAPHPMQCATLAYFQLPMEYFTLNLSNKYKSRILSLITILKEVGFVNVVFPQGAYYIFCQYRCPNNRKGVKQLYDFDQPMEAAMYLIQKCGVACVPGDNFYGKQQSKENNSYLRFAACRSLNDIQNACHRIQQHLTPL